MAAYPITPASEIMEYIIKKLPSVGGAVIQTEDEIAAATMAIGANYGGVRAINSVCRSWSVTKMEAIGLSGMTENLLLSLIHNEEVHQQVFQRSKNNPI